MRNWLSVNNYRASAGSFSANANRRDHTTTQVVSFDCNDINHSTDELLLAIMARLIRIESMVCSLSVLTLKHISEDNVSEYQALSRWLGAMRSRIVETSLRSHAEQFPELSRFIEEHVELSERDLMEMFRRVEPRD